MRYRRDTLTRGKGKRRVLVDTTFLLPALGIEVEKEAMGVIKYFHDLNVYYTEFGLLEAMWKVIKLVNPKDIDVVRLGLKAIENTYSVLKPPSEAYLKAWEIFLKGHRDFIDALYYSTAVLTRTPLLTIDKEFIKFLAGKGYLIKGVIYTPASIEELLN